MRKKPIIYGFGEVLHKTLEYLPLRNGTRFINVMGKTVIVPHVGNGRAAREVLFQGFHQLSLGIHASILVAHAHECSYRHEDKIPRKKNHDMAIKEKSRIVAVDPAAV